MTEELKIPEMTLYQKNRADLLERNLQLSSDIENLRHGDIEASARIKKYIFKEDDPIYTNNLLCFKIEKLKELVSRSQTSSTNDLLKENRLDIVAFISNKVKQDRKLLYP